MTVSENDLSSVSAGDLLLTTVSSCDVVPYDDTVLLEKLDSLNYLCNALLFFFVFYWLESRIRSAVRGLMPNGKSD